MCFGGGGGSSQTYTSSVRQDDLDRVHADKNFGAHADKLDDESKLTRIDDASKAQQKLGTTNVTGATA